MATKARFEFTVYVSINLDEDFTADDAKSGQCQRQVERELFNYLQGWRAYPKASDCEVMGVTIEHDENQRERGDDDGREYADPRDCRYED